MKLLLALLILIPLAGCHSDAGDETPVVKGVDAPTPQGDQVLSENAARARAQGEAHAAGN